MLLSHKPPPSAEIEALAERIHGVLRTCRQCGLRAKCDSATLVIKTSLTGEALYGLCAECTALNRYPLAKANRMIAARLLGIDADEVALDGVTVEGFSERARADPGRPNREPWQHVNLDELAGLVQRKREALAHRQGGPCMWCGVTLTPERTNWTAVGGTPPNGTQCGGCQGWFDGPERAAERRTIAASVLTGISTPTHVVKPFNFGAEVGLLFFHESGRSEGATRPWAHVNIVALRRAAAEKFAYVVPEDYDPERPARRIVW